MPFDGYRPTIIAHHSAGPQTATANKYRWVAPGRGKIVGVKASVNNAPTGSPLIIDVNVADTTIYTNQANRPTIGVGALFANGGVAAVRQVAENQVISIDVDQIGSTTAGSNLSVTIQFIPDDFA